VPTIEGLNLQAPREIGDVDEISLHAEILHETASRPTRRCGGQDIGLEGAARIPGPRNLVLVDDCYKNAMPPR